MGKIVFEPKDFLHDKYFDYSIEEIATEECKIHGIFNGIFSIASNYSKFIANILPILHQIDKFKTSKNKEVLEDTRRALLLYANNQIEDIKNLEKDHPSIYKMMTESYVFGEDNILSGGISYKLSLRSIKDKLDILIFDIKDMAMYRDISSWKRFFSTIENDLRNIYNEIVSFEFIFSTTLMNQSGVEKIDYMRGKGSRGDKVKIKSISDISKYSYEVIKTLEEFYKLATETLFQLLCSVSICDPSGAIGDAGGNIENVHKDVEEDFGEVEEEDGIEDFINTED